MEHISLILQETLDSHAEKVEVESPTLAEQIRDQMDKLFEPVESKEEDLKLVV